MCEYNDDEDDIAQVCCLGFSRFFFSRIRLLLLTRTLLHQSEKHFDKKEKILVIWGGAFNKRRDFETTRFSFSFLLRTRREKKDTHSRQESFHLLQKSARALKEHRHTRAHKTRERERKRRRRFFLLLYFVFVLFARTTERERKREDILSSRLFVKEREKTLPSSCF